MLPNCSLRRPLSCLLYTVCILTLSSVPAWAVPVTGNGPGGMGTTNGSSSLELWLKSDTQVFADAAGTIPATTTVVRWNDLSGNNRHAIADVGGREPTYTGAAMNGNSTLTFTGGALNTGSRMTVAANSIQFPAYPMTGNETAFFALDFATGMGCCRGIMSDNNVFANEGYDGGLGGMFESHPFTFSSDYRINGVNTPTVSGTANTPHIITGLPVNTPVGNRALRLGSGHGGNPDYGGRMGEVILFSTALNAAQQVVMENYVSSRNGIAINTGGGGIDVYAGDTGANGDYDEQVFGIGQTAGGVSHLNGGSGGFGFEASTLDNNDWLLAGHDGTVNAIIELDNVDPNAQEPLTGSRWERVYYADKTGALDATLGFDFEDSGLTSPTGSNTFHLLYSADDDFSDGWQELGVTSTITGGLVTFNVLDANLLDGYYTLGLNIQQVPEPSTCGLVLLGAIGMLGSRRSRRMKSEG